MMLFPWLVESNEGVVIVRGRARLPQDVALPPHTLNEVPIAWRVEAGVLHFEVEAESESEQLDVVIRDIADTIYELGGTCRIDACDWRAKAGLDDVVYLPCGAVIDTDEMRVVGDGVNPRIPAEIERDLRAIFGGRYRLGPWSRADQGNKDWVASIELDLEEQAPAAPPALVMTLINMPAIVREVMARHGGRLAADDDRTKVIGAHWGPVEVFWDEQNFPAPNTIGLVMLVNADELQFRDELAKAKACAEELREVMRVVVRDKATTQGRPGSRLRRAS